MSRKYTPVEQQAVQWAKLFKKIQAAEHGIAVYDLAAALDLPLGDAGLERGLEQLHRQGRISWAIGKSKKGLICRVVTAVVRRAQRGPRLEEETDA